MEEYKSLTVWDLLMFLQGKVKQNSNIIRDNNDAINSVDSNQNFTPELLHRIKTLTKLNTNLSEENTTMLGLFNSLLELHKSHKSALQSIADFSDLKLDVEATNAKAFEDSLVKTLQGKIALDSKHPFISDKNFLIALMERFTSNEDYESCQRVQGFLNSLLQ